MALVFVGKMIRLVSKGEAEKVGVGGAEDQPGRPLYPYYFMQYSPAPTSSEEASQQLEPSSV